MHSFLSKIKEHQAWARYINRLGFIQNATQIQIRCVLNPQKKQWSADTETHQPELSTSASFHYSALSFSERYLSHGRKVWCIIYIYYGFLRGPSLRVATMHVSEDIWNSSSKLSRSIFVRTYERYDLSNHKVSWCLQRWSFIWIWLLNEIFIF